jgi:O-antigen/teichoic acid export membrane protein
VHSTDARSVLVRRSRTFLSDELTRASGGALLAQLITLPIWGISGLISARIQVVSLGPSGYGSVSIITSLPALLPFANLGVGADVVNSVGAGKAEVVQTFARSFRILVRNCLLLCLAAVALWAMRLWHILLNFPADDALEASATAGIILFAASLPLGLGYSLALGAGRNREVICLQAISPVVNIAILCALHQSTANPYWYVLTLMATPLPGALLACRLGARALDVPIGDLLAGCRFSSSGRVTHSVARAMMVVSLACSLTYQTDRIVISHMLGTVAVARYSATASLQGLGIGLVTSAGMALWPKFSQRRREGRTGLTGLGRTTLWFAAGVAPMAALLVLLVPWATALMTHGQATAGRGLAVAFALLLFLIATHLPSGMLLTDAFGFRVQAWGHALMALTSIALSIVLCARVGVAGPVLASSIAFVTCVWPATAIGLRKVHAGSPTGHASVAETLDVASPARLSAIPSTRSAESVEPSSPTSTAS